MRGLAAILSAAALLLAAAPPAPVSTALAPPPLPLPALPGGCPPVPPGMVLPAIQPFNVTADDGTVLRGHVYIAHDAPQPAAVVLVLSPYWGTRPGVTRCLLIDEATDPVVGRGFAFAAMSVRGTGESDGCLQFGSGLDRSDARAVVEALGYAGFSTGAVGMLGGSYEGETAFTALASGAPSLKAVAAASPVLDWHSVHTRGGAAWFAGDPALPAPVVPAAFIPGVGLNAFGLAGVGPDLAVNVPPVSHALCPIHAAHVAEDALLLQVGDRTPYWEDRDQRPGVAGTRVPVLFVNGLRNLEETVLQTDGLWAALAGEKRFVLGQWNHLGQPPESMGEAVDWFDQHLRGAPPKVPAGVVMYQDDARLWHNASAWPPPGQTVELLLSDGALLPPGSAVAASEQAFASPWGNPCLGLCLPATTSAQPPPLLYEPVCGPFQAFFVSSPVAERVVLAGNFRVAMTLTSTLPAGHLSAFLYQSASGACPDPAQKEVRRAIGSLRHVADPRGADFPMGTPTAVHLASYPFAAVVPAGQRLVLAIGGEASSVVPSAAKPLLTVSTGPGLAGALELTAVEGTLRFT